MRWIISGTTALWKISNQNETDSSQSLLKSKPSNTQRDVKESKMDKSKKESEIFSDEIVCWKPWYHIWPKDGGSRFNSSPVYNAGGKYCVKIFWMVSFLLKKFQQR